LEEGFFWGLVCVCARTIDVVAPSACSAAAAVSAVSAASTASTAFCAFAAFAYFAREAAALLIIVIIIIIIIITPLLFLPFNDIATPRVLIFLEAAGKAWQHAQHDPLHMSLRQRLEGHKDNKTACPSARQ